MIMYQKSPNTMSRKKDYHSQTGTDQYCHACGRLFGFYQMNSNYFKYLSASLFNDKNWNEKVDMNNLENLTRSIFNQGYYEKFFREGRKLGRGARGSVYHCQHFLESVILGEFAIKKIPVGNYHSSFFYFPFPFISHFNYF